MYADVKTDKIHVAGETQTRHARFGAISGLLACGVAVAMPGDRSEDAGGGWEALRQALIGCGVDARGRLVRSIPVVEGSDDRDPHKHNCNQGGQMVQVKMEGGEGFERKVLAKCAEDLVRDVVADKSSCPLTRLQVSRVGLVSKARVLEICRPGGGVSYKRRWMLVGWMVQVDTCVFCSTGSHFTLAASWQSKLWY